MRDARLRSIVQIVWRKHRQAGRNRSDLDPVAIPQAAAIAEPEGVGIVGDDKIEAAIGVRVERAERRRRGGGIGMIQGFEHQRSEEHTSELQSLMRISYAVFCLKKKTPSKLRPLDSSNNTTPPT